MGDVSDIQFILKGKFSVLANLITGSDYQQLVLVLELEQLVLEHFKEKIFSLFKLGSLCCFYNISVVRKMTCIAIVIWAISINIYMLFL